MSTPTVHTIRLQDAASVEWHGHWASPWVGMCIDYAAEKGVQLEPMTMRDREEMTEITGQPRMPAVIMTMADGSRVCVSESTRIIELLDRSYPAPEHFCGWSDDAATRARQELIEHGVGAIHQQVLETAQQELGPNGCMPALLDNALAEQVRIFDAINRLAEGAAPFLFGAQPSVVDYQVFHAEPFNRCITGGMLLAKRDRAKFDELASKMPILAMLGDADFSKVPDVHLLAQGDAYLRWREVVDDRREANGLRRGCLWQKTWSQMNAG